MNKKALLGLILLSSTALKAQPVIDSWIRNTTGKTSSYWENTAMGGPPTYVFHTSTDSADVLKVCYSNDSVWVSSNGMTDNMGKYLNPGSCIAQDYIFRFPRNPSVSGTKVISPKVGSIGALINGIPIYGLSNANSWDAGSSSNQAGPGGDGIWNVEVGLSEGFVLDTAFGAHPQQQGAYHTHTTPWRFYRNLPTNAHSPIVGYAYDGYPIYGPYGYSDPTNASSGVTRMTSGYSLRNITQRHSLPYGVSLSSGQYGPDVNTTYPIGTYCEDYEWLASNGGHLDKYNGRFCITPEYPAGTYAYFVTMDAAGEAEFPYYIGIEYYGAPDQGNFVPGGSNTSSIDFPTSGTSCLSSAIDELTLDGMFNFFPNPTSADLTVIRSDDWTGDYQLIISNTQGAIVHNESLTESSVTFNLSNFLSPGFYLVTITSNGKTLTERIVLQ